MRKNLSLMLCIILVTSLCITLISAVPPVQTTLTEKSLLITYPQYEYVKLDSNFTLYIHVYNTSQYIRGSTASCFLDLYNPEGIETMSSPMIAGGSDYYIAIAKGNFSMLGLNSFIIQCNTTSQSGFASGIFSITNSGVEITSGKAIVDVGLLFVLLTFFIITIYILISSDNLLVRVGMIGLGYILLMTITFIAWNMGNDFLVSAPFIASIFRILFFVLIAGFFPLILGGFAWYLLMLWKIKEIQRLMDKGYDPADAEKRAGRKKR